MILTTIDELRLTFPTHAIDDIKPLVGVIDNSEHDFLLEKLGAPLYNKMCAYYNDRLALGGSPAEIADTDQTCYYNRLILICQRVVAYDAIGRAVGTHILSLNNAGINIPTADDYGKVDLEAVRTFQKTCTREAHAAINRLLQTLEEWCQQSAMSDRSRSDLSSSSSSDDGHNNVNPSFRDDDGERNEIVTLWRHSRYYYLAASLLIPSAVVLQDYWNTYDSREKFIQMLPDLRYIQEEVIAPAIGEEFMETLVAINRDTIQSRITASATSNAATPASAPPVAVLGHGSTEATPVPSSIAGDSIAETAAPTPMSDRSRSDIAEKTIEKLRKAMAAMLEERTLVINTDKLRRQQAHDEAVRLLQSAITFIQSHQEGYNIPATVPDGSPSGTTSNPPLFPLPSSLYTALKLSPLYDPTKATPAATVPVASAAGQPSAPAPDRSRSGKPKFANNRRDSAMFVTPFLN